MSKFFNKYICYIVPTVFGLIVIQALIMATKIESTVEPEQKTKEFRFCPIDTFEVGGAISVVYRDTETGINYLMYAPGTNMLAMTRLWDKED